LRFGWGSIMPSNVGALHGETHPHRTITCRSQSQPLARVSPQTFLKPLLLKDFVASFRVEPVVQTSSKRIND